MLVLAALILPSIARAADVTPDPKVDPSLIGDHKREVILEIKFAASGKVSSATVIKESGSPKLDKAVASFVRENWKMTSEAGRTAHEPFDFTPAPKVAAQPKKAVQPNAAASDAQSVPAAGLSGYGGSTGFLRRQPQRRQTLIRRICSVAGV